MIIIHCRRKGQRYEYWIDPLIIVNPSNNRSTGARGVIDTEATCSLIARSHVIPVRLKPVYQTQVRRVDEEVLQARPCYFVRFGCGRYDSAHQPTEHYHSADYVLLGLDVINHWEIYLPVASRNGEVRNF